MIYKKKMNLLLISIAFALWMVIFFKFILDTNNEDESIIPTTNRNIVEKEEKSTADSTYANMSLKDPFVTPFNKKKKPKPKKTIQKINKDVPRPPKLELLGILNDQNRSIALVKFPDRSVHFVKKSQEIGNVKIIEINANNIDYKFGKDLYNLVLK